ncbi:hypothetical protein EVAR_51389_1 [Eumeta japonica]|uniref:Uncharacterized protein n=1 Tax=Eumeta variegata TaxID=151549 RepID=A0A4C1ZQD0_EUMVA|nr:hypothetical protein EVAR_51389_1 [Eumeta japonica]
MTVQSYFSSDACSIIFETRKFPNPCRSSGVATTCSGILQLYVSQVVIHAQLGRHSSLFMSQQSPERWRLTYDQNKESTEMSAKVRPPAHAARGDPNACSVLLDAGF